MAIETGQQDEAALARDEATMDEARSQFERICDFLTEQFGAVRQVEAGQQSAERLLDLAEDELSDLKREFAAARLGSSRR